MSTPPPMPPEPTDPVQPPRPRRPARAPPAAPASVSPAERGSPPPGHARPGPATDPFQSGPRVWPD